MKEIQTRILVKETSYKNKKPVTTYHPQVKIPLWCPVFWKNLYGFGTRGLLWDVSSRDLSDTYSGYRNKFDHVDLAKMVIDKFLEQEDKGITTTTTIIKYP